MKDYESTPAIVCYMPETNTWIPAGELPQSLFNSTCISVADNIYVFGGNIKYQHLKNMYYNTY